MRRSPKVLGNSALFAIAFAASALGPRAPAEEPAAYANPVIEGNLADPCVIVHEGTYYLYATGEVDGDNGTRVYTSPNLVDWKRGPVVFRPGEPHVWAPDVFRDPRTGRFYLYYTVNQTVGVAEAEGPLGPFQIRRKFFDRAIDAHLFRDDDGRLYLYFVKFPGFRISVQPMASPTEPEGEPKAILWPESDWEKRAGEVTEGPWMLRHAGRYYLLYSGSGANTPDYAVGYAISESPLGPFRRAAENPIVRRSESVFGPGHGCAVRDGAGRWWHVYHQKRTDRVEWDRFIAIDPLWFDEEGRLHGRATRGVRELGPVPPASVRIHPAPAGEPLSRAFAVRVEGEECPVYIAKVAPRDPERRWRAMDDKKNSAEHFETAAFATFDVAGPARVTVTCAEPVRSARVLPSSLRIAPAVDGRTVSFELPGPRHVVVEVNDDWVGSLQIFANPLETDVPKPGDPDAIYFGPGIHEVRRVVVGDSKTVYVAGGAVVRCGVGPDEPHSISSYSGLRNYAPAFELRGKGIRFRGRGIVDGSACPTHARNLLFVHGEDIEIEGVILRDSSTWTIPIRRSERVAVRNVKILGYRANSDGIDVCNSSDVTVEDCFIRTLDDLIVVKTDKGAGPARRIAARRCVLWNEVAHALSVGAEIREDVDDVLFADCDVIRDKGREWTLRVYHSDAATVSNVRFEDLRVEETRKFISLWIGKSFWSRDEERGRIRGVAFRRISAIGEDPRIELVGFDEAHAVEDVAFEGVTVNGRPVAPGDLKSNPFVRGVTVKP